MSTMLTVGRRCAAAGVAAMFVSGLVGCAPEVGSQRWCEQMSEKPRGDWSTNEALDYTRYCIFDRGEPDE